MCTCFQIMPHGTHFFFVSGLAAELFFHALMFSPPSGANTGRIGLVCSWFPHLLIHNYIYMLIHC